MAKFMKYEIKGNYKFILGILAVIILASSVIQGSLLNATKKEVIGENVSDYIMLLSVIGMLVIFGAFLLAFINIVGSFRKELYDDRGYLTFTLPLTGNQIVGSKLIVALLWFTILGIVTLLYNMILATLIFDIEWRYLIDQINMMIGEGYLGPIIRGVAVLTLITTIASIMSLLFIYLSMAIGKVSFKNRKISGLWFVIYLIIFGFSAFIIEQIGDAASLYINLSDFSIANNGGIGMIPEYYSITSGFVLGYNSFAYINLTSIILEILFSIGAFVATGYLIEKKIDL